MDKKGMLLNVNPVYAFGIKSTTVIAFPEVRTDPAYIIDYRGYRSVVGMRKCTELPFLFGLCQKLAVIHGSDSFFASSYSAFSLKSPNALASLICSDISARRTVFK
jgi:hypothetical protein